MGRRTITNGELKLSFQDLEKCLFLDTPLLGICPEDCPSYLRDTCTPIFITALFTIARTWIKSRCPSIEEWIMRMWYLSRIEFYSAAKKN